MPVWLAFKNGFKSTNVQQFDTPGQMIFFFLQYPLIRDNWLEIKNDIFHDTHLVSD